VTRAVPGGLDTHTTRRRPWGMKAHITLANPPEEEGQEPMDPVDVEYQAYGRDLYVLIPLVTAFD
jgi:hypothetical protein